MVQNKHLYGSKQTLIWFKANTYMVQSKHLYGSKKTFTWFKTNTYMVQNKHLHGSKQTLIWFKTNTYMVQNKHLYGAVQHDCVLFNSYMFRPQSIIIRPQEQYLKKKVKMQCKICYRVYRAGAILKMPYCVISLSLSLWCNSPQWARASSLSKLHDRTQTSHIR